jgi:ribonuclease Z
MTSRLILYGILAAVMAVSWLSTCVIYRAAEIGELVAPLETRYFDGLQAIAIGTGGGYENPERLGPSIAIGWEKNLLLVDTGRGVAESLRRAQLALAQPQTVFLSNLLAVNTVGLDDLLLTGWRQPREAPLRVIGPPGTARLCEFIMAAHRAGIEAESQAMLLPLSGAELIGVDVEGGWTTELEGLKIVATDLPGGPITALAWRFEYRDRSIVVAGAGWAPDAVVEAAKNANVLFHEAVIIPEAEGAEEAGILIDPELLRREAAMHTAVVDVGLIGRRARVDTLVLVRMRPPPFYNFQIEGTVRQTFGGDLVIASDGDEIEW